MSDTVFLKVSSAFMVGGQIAKAGEVVEVTTAEAKDLLQRGKAELATVSDEPKRVIVEAEEVEQGEEAAPVEQPKAAKAKGSKKAK